MPGVTPSVKEYSSTFSPCQVYQRVCNYPYSFFLDSGMNHDNLGRYSFIGFDPFMVFKSKGNRCHVIKPPEQDNPYINTVYQDQSVQSNPFDLLKELLREYKVNKIQGLPPLTSGVVGYWGYDLGQQLELLPNLAFDDLNVPDCVVGFYDSLLIYDHQRNIWITSVTGLPEFEKEKQQARVETRQEQLSNLLLQQLEHCEAPGTKYQDELNIYSNFSPEGYQSAVQKAKDYIAAGDIFQVNLSQRFTASLPCHPWDLYKQLRTINPAPFASYFNLPDVIIASASPERFLLVRDGLVETRPIKGTRPRGVTPEEDLANRQELLNSAKDRAELVMIIDLERNDLGRACEIGSIRVPDLIRLEEYATVFHLVSTVEGQLPREKGVVDLLCATFPGGSITGAPKIRSMEIIEELEPVKRGIYTGSIGYIDFNGDADLNIVIRTYVIKDGKVHYQVGGGIVADSSPEAEYYETLAKGYALKKALEQVIEDK